MTILNRKWIYSVVIGVVLVGGIALAPYLFHMVERQFYAKPGDPLGTINAAEETYRSVYPKRGYSRTLAELSGTNCGTPTETSACLIDQALANATSAASAKSGYVYTYVTGPPNAEGVIESYSVHGDPATNKSGANHFYTDQTGVIRIKSGKPADKDSPIRKSDY